MLASKTEKQYTKTCYYVHYFKLFSNKLSEIKLPSEHRQFLKTQSKKYHSVSLYKIRIYPNKPIFKKSDWNYTHFEEIGLHTI